MTNQQEINKDFNIDMPEQGHFKEKEEHKERQPPAKVRNPIYREQNA